MLAKPTKTSTLLILDLQMVFILLEFRIKVWLGENWVLIFRHKDGLWTAD